jgi:hypothetical protein
VTVSKRLFFSQSLLLVAGPNDLYCQRVHQPLIREGNEHIFFHPQLKIRETKCVCGGSHSILSLLFGPFFLAGEHWVRPGSAVPLETELSVHLDPTGILARLKRLLCTVFVLLTNGGVLRHFNKQLGPLF